MRLPFQKTISQCFDILKTNVPEVYHQFTEDDFKGETARIYETQLTQVVIFINEYAISQLLKEWGIQPDFMIGHSMGEYVAACLAEVFTLKEALGLVAQRGRLTQSYVPPGTMLIVQESEKWSFHF